VKRRIYNIIEVSAGKKHSHFFDIFIIGLIILSVISIVLESFDYMQANFSKELKIFEYISVTIFSLEYLLRLWTCELKYSNKSKIGALGAFVFSAFGIIDLLAILPFYLPLIINVDLRFVRILRLFRLLRIFKLDRYTHSMHLVVNVLKDKVPELSVTLFVTFLMLFISATLMYYIEHDNQPEVFPNIIASFWWSITTLTTVGYGDAVPITGLGKIIASFMALLGIAVVALPTAIISSSFIEKIQHTSRHKKCPHCGEELE
jgi:voltage-gated potassium channel